MNFFFFLGEIQHKVLEFSENILTCLARALNASSPRPLSVVHGKWSSYPRNHRNPGSQVTRHSRRYPGHHGTAELGANHRFRLVDTHYLRSS